MAQLWPWLPAFRTVAETEHLPTAAEILELSTSALSRSVKQLEDCLGEPLFTREGRRMKLNRAGERLLVAVRDAMRRIDDGVEHVSAGVLERIRIAGDPVWIELLALPSLDGASLDVIEVAEGGRASALLRGEIDLALCEQLEPSPQLVIDQLGDAARAVCWSPAVDDAAILPFAVYRDEGLEAAFRHEHVALRTTSLELILGACRSGQMRAALPVAIAQAHQLRVDAPHASSPVFLVQRSLLIESPLAPFVARLKQRSRELLARRDP